MEFIHLCIFPACILADVKGESCSFGGGEGGEKEILYASIN
jgi:hypothetical protein